MSWIELHIKTSAEHANMLADKLTLLGADAVSFLDAGDQPIYEPSAENPRLWSETIVVGLFDSHHPIEKVIQYLEEEEARGLLQHFHLQHLEDQDWQRLCLDSFKPVHFGNRLWICPSWHTPPDANAINVTLDPGLAFGTGSHPTTALCLEWLAENTTGTEDLVIDYGCGSGILAVAAVKLGAKKVIGIDNDPQALEATRSNAERNHLTIEQLETCFPEKIGNISANILIANILAQPLIELAPRLAELTQPGGKLVLSGILVDQAIEIIDIYKKWFDLNPPVIKGEWVRLDGIKRTNFAH